MPNLMVPDAVERFLADARLRGARVIPLTGDASDRRYFRVQRPGGAPVVLALYATPFDFATLPFANVAELFAAIGVPTPRVLSARGDLGILVLEDLGDLTLQAQLGIADDAARARLYRRAIDHLMMLQRGGVTHRDDRFVPFRTAFDEAKLSWEMDFFARHFLEGYRGASLSPATRAALARELGAIVRDLAAEPRVLCHRDYHSRNLMVHEHDLYVIDFQDARMGPDTYDVVSLLRDSYVDLPEPLVDDLLAEFATCIGRRDVAEFRRRFDLMAVQRNLKALGTFGYQATARGNPVYAQYVPRTLGYVRATLSRHDRFHALHAVLAGLLPEVA